ncbi:DUF2721 domain-containing protein [Rhizosaccharibacter radicis]|uniref:DUF2721 domain-containing protein n=1 Tax=Rhizosaccharibacter radicis TaxID=2782605 RepID=A0ABT1VUL5_9PROT|nr:DUF2721 domain-containing protein [Acetobacteraceae bacterium KSS12]
MAFPFNVDLAHETADSVAHIIQTALTPVFMLSGIGTLLNLFNTRLARVSDHIEQAADLLEDATEDQARSVLRRHLTRLHRRTILLDVAILLGAVGGAATCGAAFDLFLGSVRDDRISAWLVGLFGVALLCTATALGAFLLDSVFAWHGLRMEGPLPRKKTG